MVILGEQLNSMYFIMASYKLKPNSTKSLNINSLFIQNLKKSDFLFCKYEIVPWTIIKLKQNLITKALRNIIFTKQKHNVLKKIKSITETQ